MSEKRNIIFINGLFCPISIGKSPLFWDHDIWPDNYHCMYQPSIIPLSNNIVNKELDRLIKLVSQYSKPIVAGVSLGAWWAANLACQLDLKIDKLVLFTPLATVAPYPIFHCSNKYNPINQSPTLVGADRVLVVHGKYDWVVPTTQHAQPLISQFYANSFVLDGGHFFHKNHYNSLRFIKRWIRLNS